MDAQEGSHAVSRAVSVVQTSGPEWGPCQGLDAVTWNRDMQEHCHEASHAAEQIAYRESCWGRQECRVLCGPSAPV